MKNWFGILLISVAFFVGVGVGGQVDVIQLFPAVLGSWIGLVVLAFFSETVIDALSTVYAEPKQDEHLGDTQEIVILAVKQGEVVGELRTWGPSLAEGKRKFWAKKLPRIFTRRAREVAPSEQ